MKLKINMDFKKIHIQIKILCNISMSFMSIIVNIDIILL